MDIALSQVSPVGAPGGAAQYRAMSGIPFLASQDQDKSGSASLYSQPARAATATFTAQLTR